MNLKYPEVDVVIICNEHDEVAGAIGSNVVVLVDDVWLTPPLESGSAPTAFRNRLIRSHEVVERIIKRDQLLAAAGIGVLDDVYGWRTVVIETEV